MKIKLTIRKEFDVKYLRVNAEPRYWEDAEVNGIEDTEGELMPFANTESLGWCPIIDVDAGVIVDWPIGTTAKIHYKVCDAGFYELLDADKNVIASREGYVIDALDPDGNGYGDYIKMTIDENGKIKNWKPDFSDFESEGD